MPAAPPRLLLPLCLLLLILPLLPDAARGAEDAVWVARRLQAALAAKHAANTTTSTTNSRPLAPQHAPPARSVAPALLAALRDREAQTAVLCDDAHALLAQWLLRRGDGRRWRIHALRQPLRPRDLAVPRVVLVAEFGAARRVLQRWAAADLAQPRWILGPAAGAAYATLPAVLRARLGSVEALQPRLGDPRAIRAAAGFARAWQSVAMQRWPADVRAAAAEDLSRMEVAEDEDACWRRFQGFESQPLDDADASWVFADAAVLQPNASQQGLFWDDGQAILEADALLQQLGAPYGWLDAVVVAESVATVMRASQPNFSGLEWALSTLSDGHSALALDLARRDDLLSLAADLLSSNGTTVHSHDNCPHHSYILPLIVGILALLAVLSILYYCGRKHIGASLFEQTLRAERDAQVARQNAEIKASFLANMSHEIRTPLHAILSMGRMLMESRQMDPNADAQDLEDLAQIIRSSETLEALVNDVLFISKMQTSSFTLVNKPFDVCEMMEDVTQLLSLRWESKHVECIVVLDLPEFSFYATADPLRLRQVLTNLSTNAMKFTDVGHVVLSVSLVSLHETDDYASPPGETVPHLLFRVEDTGAGMNKETMYNLFQRFFQGAHTITQAVGGAGLGLAIAAELVSIMGGTIGVYSEAEGHGSEFWFTLPVVYHDPNLASNRIRNGDLYDGGEMKQHVARVAYESSHVFGRPIEVPLPPELAKVCETQFTNDMVLVVVPNEGLRQAMERLLRRWNLRFASGPTYDAACAMLAWDPTARRDADGQLRANIVIVDIEAQQLRREVTQQADTRFIFLCSDSHRRHLLRDVGQHWYTQCENYTLLNKPVKRQFLWTALTSQGHIEEAPTTAAIERIQNEFSFRRGDRPLRKHPPRNPGANDQSPASSYRRQADAASSHAGSQHSYASQRASDHRASPRSDRFIFSFGQSGGGGASGGAGGSSSLHGAKASSSGPHLAPANSSASATLAMAASGGASTTMVGSSATLNGVVTPPLLTIDQTPGSSALDLAETSDAAKQPPLAAAAAPPATAPSIEEVDLVTAQPARILLAEDNQINVKIAVRYLSKAGYECVLANDGMEAVNLWQTQAPFDLILMDCQMPNVDGFEATARIRALERERSQGGREVPIVAMTAFSMPEDQERCLEHGMNDYISKPFTREVLLEVVAKWLQAAAATPISSNAESAMPSPTPPDWQFTTTGDKAGQQQHKRDTPTTSASASPAMGRPAPDAAAALTPPMARGASGRLNRPTAPTHLPIPSVATATAQQKLQKQPSQPPPSQKLQQQQQLLLPQSPLHYPPPAPLILSPTQARPPAATGTSTSSVFSDQPAGSQLPSTPASGQTSILRSPPTGMAPKAPAAHRLSRDMSSSGSLGSAGSGNRPRPPSTGALPVASMDVAAMLGQVLQSKPPPLPGVAKDVSKDVARTAPNRPDAPIGTTQSSEVPGSAASVAAAAATSSPKASSDKTAVAVLPPPTINLTSLFTSLPAPTTLPQPSNLPPAPPYTAALQSSSRVASLQRDAQRTPSPARPAPRSTPQDSSSTSHPLPRSPMMSHRPTPQRPARRSSPVFPAADSPRRQQTKRLPEPAALATAASKDDDASSERYV